MRIAFILNNEVTMLLNKLDIIRIAQANQRKWQVIIETSDESVQVGWNYNELTGQLEP